MKTRAGGSIHSRENLGPSNTFYRGLTKREYFAAKAMQGFTASPEFEAHEVAAEYAVERADALIDALNKEEKS